jgi:large subunit ribosomal protein L32e
VRKMKDSKPEFKRQESWRYKRVRENWRRPRGVTSKMRKEESGFPAKVKVGYGSDSTTRGLHPRGLIDQLVWRETELDKLDPKLHIVRIAGRVGERKRLGIIAKAKEHNFHIANPGKEESRPVTEPAAPEQEAPPVEVEPVTQEAETVQAATEEESPSEDETE